MYPHFSSLCADLPYFATARVMEQFCFNSTPDPFNGQTANFTLKPPKIIESTTYAKKKSGVLLKQHCSITLAIAQQDKSACVICISLLICFQPFLGLVFAACLS